jgi:hypothetical protein
VQVRGAVRGGSTKQEGGRAASHRTQLEGGASAPERGVRGAGAAGSGPASESGHAAPALQAAAAAREREAIEGEKDRGINCSVCYCSSRHTYHFLGQRHCSILQRAVMLIYIYPREATKLLLLQQLDSLNKEVDEL